MTHLDWYTARTIAAGIVMGATAIGVIWFGGSIAVVAFWEWIKRL